MLKNKLVEQILAERFYFIEAATGTSPTSTPSQTTTGTPSTPTPATSTGSTAATTTPNTTNATDAEMLALAILTMISKGGSIVDDIKKLLSPPNPIKTDPDVFLSKIPSMLRPETIRNPKLQRVKEFGSAEGKIIAS